MPKTSVIRLARESDAAAIREIYAPIVRETHISFEQNVPSAEEIAGRIRSALRQHPWLVCELAGRLAGYAYASAFRSRAAYQWTTETTVYVHRDYQRRGIARALYSSLIAILRTQGYVTAVGVIALPNQASVLAHEAIGFEKIGIFQRVGFKAGEWRDTGWWQLDLNAPSKTPASPQPVTKLASEPSFPSLLSVGLKHIRP